MRRNARDWLGVTLTVGTIVLGIGGTAYMEKRHDARIDTIMTGEVRGNKDTHIYHVPTCPQYDDIKPGRVRTFETVGDAEEANYRPSRNCLDAATTRNLNETEIDEGPDAGYDGARY